METLFSVKTTEEFNAQMGGLMPDDHIDSKNVTFKHVFGFQAPQEIDWRKAGRVSSVKDQVQFSVREGD